LIDVLTFDRPAGKLERVRSLVVAVGSWCS
jgi:hypothetical protein